MTIAHTVSGYDKRTERLAIEHDIPADAFEEIRILADVPSSDRDAIGTYPLAPRAAHAIAERLATPLNVEGYDWFLEPQTDG